jgi:hypothetical protein
MYSPSSSASFSSSCSIDTGHGGRSIHSSIPDSSHNSNHGNDFCSSSSSHHRWSPMPCNKCGQPIDATAFVCSCDCLFCEGKSTQIRSSVDAFFTALRLLFVDCNFPFLLLALHISTRRISPHKTLTVHIQYCNQNENENENENRLHVQPLPN